MGRVTARRPVRRISAAGTIERPDTLAVEEPMEIRIGGESVTVTMRTPGHDVDLVHGFLLSEGIIGHRDDVAVVRYCNGTGEDGLNTYNVLDVTLTSPLAVHLAQRNFLTTSACGVCGKLSLDDVRTRSRYDIGAAELSIDAGTLSTMPDTLRRSQRIFDATGGLHAAGLFTADGALLALREDVGRHNAVDKVIGWALSENRIPASDTVLIVSGRASFELAQKAVMAGIPALGAVSAPSSLAVDLAVDAGLTLVGFLRGETMNVYAHDRRIKTA
ncbi:formate dehydrogenase accessory sulfurtransferase FdhD [Antrihabitans sp. YC2-6]|uniref:formate dehydrogenase accessory sulfurtransferase FdhD n=1 Tax=Antrihabitans sp. YC2-6 TaxID=2799498 RepID=UPI0018F3D653|nr:formate dehydrogenase accessory sulfurtransferase FdhD [Antrihabitans sp. YC2-6]MBJ8346788.1 formate dehydrogenase accessory sulfurtransferase FdhD [Antrihabitans sp. YC2-6]